MLADFRLSVTVGIRHHLKRLQSLAALVTSVAIVFQSLLFSMPGKCNLVFCMDWMKL